MTYYDFLNQCLSKYKFKTVRRIISELQNKII